MKKWLLLLLALLAYTPHAIADDEPIILTIHKRNNGNGNGSPERTPVRLMIEISYDSISERLYINAPSDLEGEIFLYNQVSSLVFYSDVINEEIDIFTLPSGEYTIIISNYNWEIIGVFYK